LGETQHLTRTARPLVESALLAALGSVLVLFGYYVPFLGTLVALLWPLPSAVAVLRHGVRWGVLSSIVTGLSLLMFIDWMTAASLWLVFAITGITFGWALRRSYSPATIIIVSGVAFLIGTVAAFVSGYLIAGFTPEKLVDTYIEAMKKATEINQRFLGPSPLLEELKDPSTLKSALLRVFPAVLLFSAVIQAYINFEVSKRVLERLGYHLDSLPPFSRWIFPDYIAFIAVASYLLVALEPSHKISFLAKAGDNAFIFAMFFLVTEAFSVISYFLIRVGFPRPVIVFLCVYLYVAPTFRLILLLLGLMDMLMDFRRLRYGWIDEI